MVNNSASEHSLRYNLTNDEVYLKILDINPYFSIESLLKRYKNWFENKQEEGELYEKLMEIGEFSAIYSSIVEDGVIKITSRDVDIVSKLSNLLDINADDDTLYVNKHHHNYHELLSALKQYLFNDICHPASNRLLYNDGIKLQFSYVQEQHVEDYPNNIDKYVEEIIIYDRTFGLNELYYRLHNQYIVADKLEEKFKKQITDILPNITNVYYMDNDIIFYDNINEILRIRDVNEEIFNSVIANIYNGINTSEVSYNLNNVIEVDTYMNKITF